MTLGRFCVPFCDRGRFCVPFGDRGQFCVPFGDRGRVALRILLYERHGRWMLDMPVGRMWPEDEIGHHRNLSSYGALLCKSGK